MGRVVILVGSERKGGNTELLAKAFAKGAMQNNEVEILSVADSKVNPCTGCNACFLTEANTCVQADDMSVVYDKLEKADVLVIASPVYFYGVSAQLKAIIDRLHTPRRNTFKIKKAALLLVGAATLTTMFDAVKMQYKLILDFFHLEDLGAITVDGVKNKGDIEGDRALEEAYELGKSIYLNSDD